MASFTGVIKTLQDLAAQTTAEDTDLIPIGTSVLKKISFANLRKALGVDALNSNITPRKITQSGSFNTLSITISSKIACLDGAVTLGSPLTGNTTDLIQLNDASVLPFQGAVLDFYNRSNKTFYQAYVSSNGMIRVLSPAPAGDYTLNGTWIIK